MQIFKEKSILLAEMDISLNDFPSGQAVTTMGIAHYEKGSTLIINVLPSLTFLFYCSNKMMLGSKAPNMIPTDCYVLMWVQTF